MAEIRKHNPESGDGLGELVRRALGETIRPTPPGGKPAHNADDADSPAPHQEEPRTDGLPQWPSDGPSITF